MSDPVFMQTALDLSETKDEGGEGPGGVPFSFDGRDYLAFLAPEYGVPLRVTPVDRKTPSRRFAIAFHAFRQRYRADIEEACARKGFSVRDAA